MENKINIANLLRDCPSGMELECLMYEDVYFDYVFEHNMIHCYIQHKTYKTSIIFNQYGTTNSDIKSKCVIFPKGKTTWEGFVPPCKFKDGDIVTCNDCMGSLVACIYKEKLDISFSHHIALYKGGLGIIINGEIILTNDELRLATEEEKAKLFKAIKDNGYKWNPETKTLEKLPKFKVGDRVKKNKDYISGIITDIFDDSFKVTYDGGGCSYVQFHYQDDWELVPNKFDVTTLKPFESKVLVRDNADGVWLPCFFGGICNSDNNYPYRIVGGEKWKCCIPYEGNEHLLGKTDDCDNFYKTWE